MAGGTGGTVLLTGATGFLGAQIARRLVREPGMTVIALVRAGSQEAAERRLERAWWDWPELRASLRVEVLAGDVAAPRLGLEEGGYTRLAQRVTHIIHTAADLRVDAPLAELRRTNLEGVAHVLELARLIQHDHGLARYAHVSTAYVAGARRGAVAEADLSGEHGFSCNYELSKYEGERLVQAAKAEMPVSVFRPGMIVGAADTGEIRTFNTFYFPLRLYLTGKLPLIPAQAGLPVNIIPVDYVAEAIVRLTFLPEAAGLNFHLTAPAERLPRAREVVEFVREWARRELGLRLPWPVFIPLPLPQRRVWAGQGVAGRPEGKGVTGERTAGERAEGKWGTDERVVGEWAEDEGIAGKRGAGERLEGQRTLAEQPAGERAVEERTAGEQGTGERLVGERAVGEGGAGERVVGEWAECERAESEGIAGKRGAGERREGQGTLEEQTAGEQGTGERLVKERHLGEQAVVEGPKGERAECERAESEGIAGKRTTGEWAVGEMLAGGRVVGEGGAGEGVMGERSVEERTAGEQGTGERLEGKWSAGERPKNGQIEEEWGMGERSEDGRLEGERTVGERAAGEQTVGEGVTGGRTAGGRAEGEGIAGKRTVAEWGAGERGTGEQGMGECPKGEGLAGKQATGKLLAGERVVGEEVAGERSEGERTVGEWAMGERFASEGLAGEWAVGEVLAGERVVGEEVAGERGLGGRPEEEPGTGERLDGEQPEGERGAGERMAGERPENGRPEREGAVGERTVGKESEDGRAEGEGGTGERVKGERTVAKRGMGEGGGRWAEVSGLVTYLPYFNERKRFGRENVERLLGAYRLDWREYLPRLLAYAAAQGFLHRSERTVHEQLLARLGSRSRPVSYTDIVDGQFIRRSAAEVREEILAAAAALSGMGIGKGDRVAVVGLNSTRTLALDAAIGLVGAVSVPLYYTSPPAEIDHILAASGARLLLVGAPKVLARLGEIQADLPVVTFGREAAPEGVGREVLAWEAFLERGAGCPRPRQSPAGFGDLATLRYTSGTTGKPKGVSFNHAHLRWMGATMASLLPWRARHRAATYLSFLPMNHVVEGLLATYCPYYLPAPVSIYYLEDLRELPRVLPRLRPAVFFAVPRIYERIWEGLEANPLGQRYLRLRPGLLKRAVGKVLRWLTLRKAGLDRCAQLMAGSAPFSPELLHKFRELGIEVHNAYGMTEAPLVTLNRLGANRLGTVGEALPETEIRIAEDGEILVRGPQVTAGYFAGPDGEEPAQPFQDGWLMTGDLGRITPEGSLAVTGRKKELFKTSYGKYVQPAKVEALLRDLPGVAEAMLVGEQRPYCVALLWALGQNLEEEGGARIDRGMAALNGELAHPEQVKRWAVLANDLSIEAGDLTANLKLRRQALTQRLAGVVEGLYNGQAAAEGVLHVGQAERGAPQ